MPSECRGARTQRQRSEVHLWPGCCVRAQRRPGERARVRHDFVNKPSTCLVLSCWPNELLLRRAAVPVAVTPAPTRRIFKRRVDPTTKLLGPYWQQHTMQKLGQLTWDTHAAQYRSPASYATCSPVEYLVSSPAINSRLWGFTSPRVILNRSSGVSATFEVFVLGPP